MEVGRTASWHRLPHAANWHRSPDIHFVGVANLILSSDANSVGVANLIRSFDAHTVEKNSNEKIVIVMTIMLHIGWLIGSWWRGQLNLSPG